MTVTYILLVVTWASAAVGGVSADECLSCRASPCRRVTGIFTRPSLPVGYNLIARVPARACNLTVSEMARSSNFLAIRTDQGYIINGNWAVLPPGRYMGAGTGFYYSHPRPPAEGGEVIHAPGPLSTDVDVMVIYQAPNQGVRYEYWHPLGPTFPPAPRGPGRGPGRGHAHSHPHPAHHPHRGRHRGPAPLQDVQPAYVAPPTYYDEDHVGVSETGVVSPVVPASATQGVGGYLAEGGEASVGGLPRAGGSEVGRGGAPAWKVWKFTPCSRTCGGGQQQTVYICTGVGGTVLTEDRCQAPKPPPQTVHCNPRPCPPEWQLGEWSQCSVTCGTGITTRTWACVQEVTPTLIRAVPPATCPSPSLQTMVPLIQPCTMAPCTRWEVTAWSQCSVECGTGLKSRQVTCLAEGRKVPDDQCNVQEKPPKQELCHGHTCAHHTWFYTDWSEECTGGCEDGIQTRRVWCSPGVNSVEGECDETQRPPESRPCARADACAAAWFTGPWTPCSKECGNGTTTREVVCVVFLSGTFRATLDIECNPDSRPNSTQPCNPDVCPPHWYYTDWSQCSRTCGRGARTRAVQCLDQDQRPSTRCIISQKPQITRTCNGPPCVGPSGTKYTERNCVDRFMNCKLVQQARLCRYSYYRTVCCASCFLQ
ncbi:ADAMTS-like protein 4 [Penaeus vannamei]|uniref:ADAMTS-like protein 4 n=1 Tax=Penaeus vannamei TaxID=6689 RepID=UPI00387F605F